MLMKPTLGFLAHDIARMIRADFAVRAERLGLTQTQWRAIAYLGRMEGCSQTELAEVCEVRPITLGRQLDRMAALGLIDRRDDPRDRRAIRLYFTPRLRAKVEKLQSIAAVTYERALAGLTAADRDTLMGLLARVRANLAVAQVSERKVRTVTRQERQHGLR
jgi:MarR family transcriptional regulator, transcriptional regulator for hemolysin